MLFQEEIEKSLKQDEQPGNNFFVLSFSMFAQNTSGCGVHNWEPLVMLQHMLLFISSQETLKQIIKLYFINIFTLESQCSLARNNIVFCFFIPFKLHKKVNILVARPVYADVLICLNLKIYLFLYLYPLTCLLGHV